MHLAAVLAFYLLGLGWSPPFAGGWAAVNPSAATDSNSPSNQDSGSNSTSQAQAPSTKSPGSAQSANSSTGETPQAAGQAQPTAKRRHHPKKPVDPDCSVSPAPVNPAAGSPTDAAKATAAGSTGTGSSDVSNANGRSNEGPARDGNRSLKPCPPPKKVVRNGGSDEPAIALVDGTSAEQASNERSTEQLRASTEENLKKIESRELTANQREMVNQIKQFMEQSKTAVTSGDAERGHNLAVKARLLSDELVKP